MIGYLKKEKPIEPGCIYL